MNRRIGFQLSIICFIMLIVCGSGPSMAQQVNPTTLPAECYLFTSFRGNGDGLHLAWSTDGLHWSALGNDRAYIVPTISAEHLMRDPCIVQGPDGTFHLIWTTGWNQKNIGYSSSKDLINWTEQKSIPVMEQEPTAKNSWAPELFWDDQKQQWLIFWATTIPGKFAAGETTGDGGLNHRVYYVTTKDFQTFTPAKLWFDPGFSVIDSTLIKVDKTYYMIFKDETRTPPKKHLRVATASSAEGPFTPLGEAFTPEGIWSEGPSVFKVGDYYYCYFDMYTSKRYGAMRTKDFKSWENLTEQLVFNVRDIRHGTAFKVSRDVMAKLLNDGAITRPAASN